MKTPILFFILLLLLTSSAYANAIAISNTELKNQDTSADTIEVEFDISWSNSWRDGVNYDAAWVFAKYSTDSGATWSHAKMKVSGTNPSGTSTGSGTGVEVKVSADLMGAFVQRSSAGSGSLSTTDVQLVWDYGVAGLTDEQAEMVTLIKVFAIEMVYVPEDDFYIGDGSGSAETTYALHVTDNTAARITSTALSGVTVDSNSQDDIDTSSITVDGDGGITGNEQFPTGWKAFYMMKYELTQAMYRDFLNTLIRAQQLNRIAASIAALDYVMTSASTVTRRDFIRTISSGTFSFVMDYAANASSGDGTTDSSTDGEGVAMNYIHWMDWAAFCDWAGLRPMTELEFEKGARGPEAPVYSGYAWGLGGPLDSGAESSSGTTAEVSSTSGTGLVNYSSGGDNSGEGSGASPSGPMRVGFAATSSTTRVTSGASYYGAMEMNGNVTELVVTVGSATGRVYRGTHGDGVLTTTTSYEGNATNTDWPGLDATTARGVTGATGTGARGGSWTHGGSGAILITLSDRTYATLADTTREKYFGGRAARSSPEYE